MAQKFTGVDAVTAALLVSVIGIFNGAGRLFWGWLSDGITRPFTFLSMFIIQAIVFAILPSITSFVVLLVPVAIIALCYGGGFGTIASYLVLLAVLVARPQGLFGQPRIERV